VAVAAARVVSFQLQPLADKEHKIYLPTPLLCLNLD